MMLALLAAVAAAASPTQNASRSRACGVAPPRSGRQEVVVGVAPGLTRTYQLYIPRNYDEYMQTPIILDFHGYYDTGDNQAEESGFKGIADDFNIVMVWPDGVDDTVVPGQQAYSWNSVGTVASPGPLGDTCKWAADGQWNGYACHSSCRPTRGCITNSRAGSCDCSTCVDDVSFVEAMLEKLEAELCIDPRRIFLTGMSNGAMMTYQLMQSRLASKFAAMAPVAGSPLLGFGEVPSASIPIMEIHGSQDRIIPANVSGSYRGEGGPHGSTQSSDGFYYEPVDRTMERYGTANRCPDRGELRHYPTRFDGQTALYCVEPYGSCPGGTVVRCSHSRGHSWPFAPSDRRDFALLVWEFFVNAVSLKEEVALKVMVA